MMHILILTSRITFHFQQNTSQNSDFLFSQKRTPAFASLHSGWREKYGPQWLGGPNQGRGNGGLGKLPPKCEKECETAFPTNTNTAVLVSFHLPGKIEVSRSFEGHIWFPFFFPKSSDSGSVIGVDIWNLKWHNEKKTDWIASFLVCEYMHPL